MAETPTGVLMVGSVPFNSVEEVFVKVCTAFPGRLKTISDGEVGERSLFITFQSSKFPAVVRRPEWAGVPLPEGDKPTFDLESILPTGYDEAAIASYAKLLDLRKQGQVPSDVRFQVCLPSPLTTVLCFVKPEYLADIEPLYEERLLQSIDRMLETIPHHDLVIQWDIPLEMMALEVERGRTPVFLCKAWFSPARAGILERLARVHQRIPKDVHVAFHLCYGDIGHAHWLEPEDSSLLVDLANGIIETVSTTHHIEYIHMPVPRDRTDAAYFEPLNNLDLNGSRLYLGLVRENDLAGTQKRIEVARATQPHAFGVASECGLGRTPKEDIDSVLAIMGSVAGPH